MDDGVKWQKHVFPSDLVVKKSQNNHMTTTRTISESFLFIYVSVKSKILACLKKKNSGSTK